MSDRKMIIHVITSLDPPGGAETMLYKLLKYRSHEFEHTVISLKKLGLFAQEISKLGVEVYALGALGFFKYIQLVALKKPLIVQAWMYHANVFALMMKPVVKRHKLLLNIRTGITNIKRKKRSTRFFIWLNAKLSGFADGVINNSNLSIQQHIDIGFCKKYNFYLPNGFEIDKFKSNHQRYVNFRKQQGLDCQCKLVGLLARYNPVKNHAGFLQIAKLLLQKCREENINIKFILAGRDCDENNLELVNKIQAQGLVDYFLLLGHIDSAELLPCLDVHLLTSYEEGFPNVVGEAMSCEVPCVATDVGDCRAVINQYGIIKDVNDYEGLSNASFQLLNLGVEDKKQIREHIKVNYAIEKLVFDYENLYTNILK